MARKTLLGNKIRRLREGANLTQARMAEQLGISASYLNLIEHDQRPVTVALLLKLGKQFDVELTDLSDDDDRKLATGLREVFADGTLAAQGIAPEEIKALAEAAPNAAKAILELYRAYRLARDDAQSMTLGLPSGNTRKMVLPAEEARDFFHDRANYFDDIEAAAEAVVAEAGIPLGEAWRGLVDYAKAKFGIAVEIVEPAVLGGGVRRYDTKTKKLLLSETLPRASRRFHLAYQIALFAARKPVDLIVVTAKLASKETETLVRVGLYNYFAGAVLMPYAPYVAAARALRYDIELLSNHFGVSFEQACHRLSTLQRPGDKGVPLWLVRTDIAGNVSKRFSAAGFHFSRFGGSCPRWIVHEAFTSPGRILTQAARLPDGATFFCVARTVAKTGGGFLEPPTLLAVGIGCEIGRAHELVYADGLDLEKIGHAVEIGVGCRVCERDNCRQRAAPPLQHRLDIDVNAKGASAYAFKK
jgi:predicted transcriptional regulator/transcriptional regulator with XRE-family HTH domain